MMDGDMRRSTMITNIGALFVFIVRCRMYCMHHDLCSCASRLMPSPQGSDFEVLKGLIGHEQGLHGLYDANQWLRSCPKAQTLRSSRHLLGHEQVLKGLIGPYWCPSQQSGGRNGRPQGLW